MLKEVGEQGRADKQAPQQIVGIQRQGAEERS